jgi:hypothetical protein
VETADQSNVLGSDQYYQLDCMADIGNRTYEMSNPSEDGKESKDPIIYRKEYPVTCVMIELPIWLAATSKTTSADFRSEDEQVWYPRIRANANGWFYRYWSYKTLEVSQTMGDKQRQIGPLMILDSLNEGLTTSDGAVDKAIGTNESKSLNTMSMVIGIVGAIAIWWFVRKSLAGISKLRKRKAD